MDQEKTSQTIKRAFWRKKRWWVLLGVPLFLFVDHQLAQLADKRIAARHYDFLENYNPDEIDWDDPNWRKCWEGRELVFYKYKTCIRPRYSRDPRLLDPNERIYSYRYPKSILWKIQDEFSFNFESVTGVRAVFYLHENGVIEVPFGKGVHKDGGEITLRKAITSKMLKEE